MSLFSLRKITIQRNDVACWTNLDVLRNFQALTHKDQQGQALCVAKLIASKDDMSEDLVKVLNIIYI